jgi:DNA polymerase-3 subunit beta
MIPKYSQIKERVLMHVITSRVDLLNISAKFQGIVPSKPALPILANVLLVAENGSLTVVATDLMMSLKICCPAQVIEEGSITLPSRRFFQLLREMTNSDVEIKTLDDKEAMVKAGSSEFKLLMMPGKEYPHFPDMINPSEFDIKEGTFKTLLQRCAFSAAKEDSRHVLNGLQMRLESNRLTMTGTDGKRLSKLFTEGTFSFESKTDAIIPLRAVEEMIKMLDHEENEIHLNINQDRLMIKSSNYQFITQLISGQYPDVDRVIPVTSAKPIALHREELMTLLRQVSLFTSDTNSSVRFTFDQGTLHLSAISDKIGQGHVNMPVNFEGEPFQIAFNPSYFLDILRHTQDETIEFKATSAYTPGLITDSSQATFVIMPMRLDTL